LWGRRSVFIVSAQPLLVLEIFLPALITCIHTSGKSKTS
jgi:chorismate-pyruvate lyase